MQYMMIIKSNPTLEAGTPVNDPGFEAIERYNQRMYEAGIWVSAEGFKPSDRGAVVTLEKGEFRVEKGPFPNPEKIDAGFWIIQVDSKEEAIDWAKQVPMLVEGSGYAKGDGEIVLMPCMEFPEEEPAPEDAEGDAAAPASGTELKRYFGGFTASPETEAGVLPDPSIFDAMGEVVGRLVAEGRFEGGGGLLPSSAATRVLFSNGTPVVTDGPFAETKEVIAGYAIFRAANLDEMIEMSKAGMEIEARWRSEPIVGVIREIHG
ncbi:MAG: hypothetical protein IT335_10005 [Thermomicrobiales bacterium]|nr:hypothetical protein [Thermomicrobiales bacterium]